MIAATPENEQERLQSLRDLGILDTENEPEFDELVTLAAAVCDMPMSTVSLVDEDRQWFKAAIGLDTRSTSRDMAICDYTIRQHELFVVEDTQRDERFAHNPLVQGGTVRFYAGMPVYAPDGHTVGALCVMDNKARTLNASQIAALKVLARDVNVRLELRDQRKRLEKALKDADDAQVKMQASEERFRLFMDNSPIVSHIKDENGRIVFYNQLFAQRFSITREEWIGKTSYDLWPEEEAALIARTDREVLSGQTFPAMRQSVHEKDGKLSYWKSYKFPLISSDGCRLIGGAAIEITEDLHREEELKRYQAELERANHLLQTLARTDALTGLNNRRGFDDRLHAEYANARRRERDLSVLVIDVDNFKQRNDLYGHPEGDATLKQLAGVLAANPRIGDVVARYGGEEFIVLLPETDEEQAVEIADRLLAAIRAQDWPFQPVSASIGVASIHPSMRDVQRLISLADEALYVAKRSGKDKVVSYRAYFQNVLQETIQNADASGLATQPMQSENQSARVV